MIVRAATPGDLDVLAKIHASSFDSPWDQNDLSGWLSHDHSSVVVCEQDDLPAGFAIATFAANQAELLTIAVSPQHRGQGIGVLLMNALDEQAATLGIESWFLEVAVDNRVAISLYERLGFRPNGRRKNYYKRPDGRVDAVLMTAPVRDRN